MERIREDASTHNNKNGMYVSRWKPLGGRFFAIKSGAHISRLAWRKKHPSALSISHFIGKSVQIVDLAEMGVRDRYREPCN